MARGARPADRRTPGAALTLAVAIECKAWNNPIDTDVVAKFHDAHLDLGIGHGLIVALAGARPRAMDMAKERGITIWGPDEMQPHLGKAQLVGLQNRPMIEEVGFPRLLTGAAARALVEKETGGRLGFGKEDVTWSGDAWLPVSVVQMTLMQMGSLRRKTAASHMWGVYDLIGGTFVTALDTEPERTSVQLDAGQIQPAVRVTDPAKTLDKIVTTYRKITSDDAKAKYRGQMANLGVPRLAGAKHRHLHAVPLSRAPRHRTEGKHRTGRRDRRVPLPPRRRPRPRTHQGHRQRPPVTEYPTCLTRRPERIHCDTCIHSDTVTLVTAQLIERARERSGLSQAELAAHAGTSRTTLNAYERGRKFPTASTLTRILDAAGFELALTPHVTFRTVPAPKGADYFVADHLWRLSPREAMRTITLPRRLEWSSVEPPVFDLRDRRQRARCYEIVLREGESADILAIIDGCLLADIWDELHLPKPLRAAWSDTIEAELS